MEVRRECQSDQGLHDVEDDSEDEHENDLEVPVDAKVVVEKPAQPSTLIYPKEDDQSGAVVKENVHWKSKSAIKQKKKDNSSKDQKESQDQSDSINVGSRTFETTDIEKAEDVSAIDVKEKLKKSKLKESQYQLTPWRSDTNHANVATQSQPHSIGAPLETSPQVSVDAQADTDWGLFGRNQNGLSGGVATSVDTDDLGRFSPLP
ncbi:hypothetical protein JHK82_024700 [Glycine max]|nr:hypothetical protein JHK85_025302 [Glycine max]KAG5133512.1 hypothetical protein JHK82_024700 [Glycine max]